jgi:type I restriction-modification system DNA methylase subunit
LAVDKKEIKDFTKLPFGLPGVNKKDKVSNGNYVWISYFYSYLNEKGRGGFVMSSQASSAGGGEAKVRQKLVETGDVDVMVAIRSNFFSPGQRAQAKLAVKDEYTFDFLEMGEEHSDRELKRALIARIEEFLRAMGGLFAFVGS